MFESIGTIARAAWPVGMVTALAAAAMPASSLAISCTQLTFDPGDDTGPWFSPDGSKIAFASSRSGSLDIWVVASTGGDPVQITDFQGDDGFTPSWSPDGEHVAYTSLANPPGWDIFRIPANGGQPTSVTASTSNHELLPSWSPDGNLIAYGRIARFPLIESYICVIPDSGGQSTQLTSGNYDSKPVWSPDGTRIAFTRWDEVWVMSASGSDVTRLTFEFFTDDAANAWSPDSKFIAFESNRTGNYDIWVVPAGGGDAIQVTSDPSDEHLASWSPDGRSMVFMSTRSGNEDLWLIPDLPNFWDPTDVTPRVAFGYLGQNYPNPFNPTTVIPFELPAASEVLLRIYDLRGRLVRTVLRDRKPEGRSEVVWDGRDDRGRLVASGPYFYRLGVGSLEESRRMLLAR
jgi:TolB protein